MEKKFDLAERTFQFGKAVYPFAKELPRSVTNVEVIRQLVRSSGSVGANYIEANESLGRRDFFMKVRTCRREAKESGYWLRLLDCPGPVESRRQELVKESAELVRIFSSIVGKQKKDKT